MGKGAIILRIREWRGGWRRSTSRITSLRRIRSLRWWYSRGPSPTIRFCSSYRFSLLVRQGFLWEGHVFGFCAEMEHCPCRCSHRGMLPSHQESDHHVRYFRIGRRSPVFILLVHEIPDHVRWVVFLLHRAALVDNLSINARHFPLRAVSLEIGRQRNLGKQEIHRRETTASIAAK